MTTATGLSGEHAEDVLGRLVEWQRAGDRCALVFVTNTEGGAVRAPGALFGVSDGSSIGYISGGCIDADVILQARRLIESGEAKAFRYGAGSPFVDLPLPCGGAIEVLILPSPDPETVRQAHETLKNRQRLDVAVSKDGAILVRDLATPPGTGDFVFSYAPKLRLRVAGRGADALALAKISDAAGYETKLQLVDEDDISAARDAGLSNIKKLETPNQLRTSEDDAWTAFVLLFHDRDWETPLLQQALSGEAFYIGAVGSRRTHANRCDALRAVGCSERAIDKIRGPIGLVGSLRDASMLAVSVLAEIVDAFPGKSSSRVTRTAVLLLAAGASSRYERGDKLMANLNGQAVLQRTAAQVPESEFVMRIAIVPAGSEARAAALASSGWDVVENSRADEGQASSLVVGLNAISEDLEIDQIIVLLADMPLVPPSHLDLLLQRAEAASITAILSDCEGRLGPPALFKREHFDALSELIGDRGAKALYLSLDRGQETVPIAPEHAVDIDRVEDLIRLEETENA